MLKSFVDKVNNKTRAVNWLKRKSPDEDVVFVSATTFTETKSIAPAKWYQRFSERRAILILTKNQLVLRNSPIFPLIVFYAFAIIAFLVLYIFYKDWRILLLIPLSLLEVLLQLPYQRQILYKDIRKLFLDSRTGTRTKLIIDTKERVIHAVVSQILPEKTLKVITSRVKTIVSS